MMQYLWIGLTVISAFALGKRVLLWALAGYLFGWVALIAVVLIPANQKKMEERQKKIEDFAKDRTEEAIIEKEFKSINTVDDLFKQLEKPKG